MAGKPRGFGPLIVKRRDLAQEQAESEGYRRTKGADGSVMLTGAKIPAVPFLAETKKRAKVIGPRRTIIGGTRG